MSKNVEATPERLSTLKQRLFAVLAMLLVAVILTVATSFAWLTMSIRPEVSGITSNIGSNGSLEIALLNSDTYKNLSTIKNPGVGESLDANSTTANERWGNLLNLEDNSYGLQQITLYPSRLNVKKVNNTYKLNDTILSIPSYGYDGRIVSLSNDTVTGIYDKESEFLFNAENLGYGVRAIGTTNNLTVQANALITARGSIAAYTSSARNNAVSSFNGLDTLLITIVGGSNFKDNDVDVLEKTINNLKASANYIESALRQGMVAYAAAYLSDATQFETARALITNESKSLSEIAESVPSLPSSFSSWIISLENIQNSLESALADCNKLNGGDYPPDDFLPILAKLMDMNKVLINGTPYPEIEDKKALATQALQAPLEITLPPKSGVYADIADFAGNYQANVGNFATIKTASAVDSYLSTLLAAANKLTAAGGGISNKPIAIDDVYGYVLDLAFRTNAFASDLLLQTEGAQRVYDDSESAATMGGGSYMEFTFKNTNFGPNDITKLMDAVRVAFVDSQGNVLGVAKLNTSNRNVSGETVKAPLYLYDFNIPDEGEEDAGKMIMGERRKDDNTITSLTQNTAKAISTVVWLDGDLVDNTMVSAEQNLTGILNLQFASSVDLTPMGNQALKNYIVNKQALAIDLETAKLTYEAGQKEYTTTSWNNFKDAYEYAYKINTLETANPMQVQRAGNNLKEATKALTKVTTDSLKSTIAKAREITGKTEIIAGYILTDEEKNLSYELVAEGQNIIELPEGGSKPFYRVDYNKNLRDEGNGYLTRIYTDESWKTLATLLYKAEGIAVIGTSKYNETEIEEIDVALNAALENIKRAVYYQPFDYDGTLYYKAIVTNPEDKDTYGKWYDNKFKRIVADLTILNLDAYAEESNIAKLGDGKDLYVSNDKPTTTLTVELKGEIYSSLKDQEIIADIWDFSGDISIVESTKKEPMLSGEEFDKITKNVLADTFDINALYTAPYQALELNINTPGDYTMTGILLTDAGVIFKCEEKINVYTPAQGVQINGSTGISAKVGDRKELSCKLNGGTETIKTTTWFLMDGSAETVSINENTGEWIAKKAGEVSVSVNVTTVQGNTYSAETIKIVVE